MYKHIFLNPFYWFAVSWLAVLGLYQLEWSTLYSPLDTRLFLFIIFISVLSIIFGIFYGKKIKTKKASYQRPQRLKCRICLFIVALGFLTEYAYEGHIPIFDVLLNTGYTYKDFSGIPTFHVFISTFSVFCAAFFFYCHLLEKERPMRRRFLFYAIFVLVWLITLYNRASLITVTFICVILKMAYMKKIKARHIILLIVFALIFLFAFGALGNIRGRGYQMWNDSTGIISVGQIDLKKYPSFLPKEYVWTYIYLISPLGNLNEYIIKNSSQFDFAGIMFCLFPDALSKRLWPSVDLSINLVQPMLTVCTCFAGIYKYGGFGGMFLMFICLSALIFLVGKLTANSTKHFIVSNAILCTVAMLMFFDNYFNFTGLTFALAYPIILSFKLNKSTKQEACSKPV